MEAKRRNFQGVLNILSFNRHYYVLGLGILALVMASRWWIAWPAVVFWIVVGAFVYGLVMPLLVSAYVYDFSGYYHFRWLRHVIRDGERADRIVSIHSGFDETSYILEARFPGADLRVFDFYDPARHTEPAIKRARKVSLGYPGTRPIAVDAIPMEDGAADIVFLLSAVHEIRSNAEKVVFLKECHRLCKPGGKVVMVEHLRDFPNFVAFSVGFTHFFSRAVWKRVFEQAGFSPLQEIKFTPFLSIFQCHR
ncbi:MAG TPA: class I SAM-dependent methyltransferase [Puia sp.]|uniref:class I SAM-dependent methyltransferase n=1 Tax=Puia sp. TaxID=2045100 RepID=UPI002C7322F7|nr:class I SAM-dependent methyltransferase [Puia sp.]HVU98491.1 class I SAM-dependent methyltransferase [Puia sp.]